MGISEHEEPQVPAARLTARALLLHGKESRKQGDETLAFALAPVPPDTYLSRLCRVVYHLRRPGVDDNADGDISLFEFLPQKSHLGLLFGDAALHPQRRVAAWIWVRFIYLPKGPRRPLRVKGAAKPVSCEVVIAVTDKDPLEELEQVVGERQVSQDTEAPRRVPGHGQASLTRPGHSAGGVNVPVEGGLILDIGDVDEDDDLVNFNSLSQHHTCGIEVVGGRVAD